MKTFFYVIEWHDGSGKTSGLMDGCDAQDAFERVHCMTLFTQDADLPSVGDIVTFNRVD